MTYLLLAIAVPAAGLLLALPLEGTPAPAALAPFGWPALVAAHLAFGLPLALLLRAGRPPVAGCVSVGLLLAGASWAFGAAIGPVLDTQGVGPAGRFVARVGWCLLVQTPWVLAWRGPERLPEGWWVLALAALALPWVYGQSLARGAERSAARDAAEGRPLQALAALSSLTAAWGSGEEADRRRVQLRQRVRELEAAVRGPIPSMPAGRRERARQLGLLGRLSEAGDLAASLPGEAEDLALLGLVRQMQRRFEESDEAYQRALTLAEGGLLASAYSALAYNARERGLGSRAVAWYEEGMARLPGHKAYFHLQLAKHYQLLDSPWLAARHATEARRLGSSAVRLEAEEVLRDVRRHTPGCLLAY
jgi:hypothetical protein